MYDRYADPTLYPGRVICHDNGNQWHVACLLRTRQMLSAPCQNNLTNLSHTANNACTSVSYAATSTSAFNLH
jgi:hypothetical protein